MLLTPQFQTYRLQSHETVHFHCFKPPCLLWQSCQINTRAQKNIQSPLMIVSSWRDMSNLETKYFFWTKQINLLTCIKQMLTCMPVFEHVTLNWLLWRLSMTQLLKYIYTDNILESHAYIIINPEDQLIRKDWDYPFVLLIFYTLVLT